MNWLELKTFKFKLRFKYLFMNFYLGIYNLVFSLIILDKVFNKARPPVEEIINMFPFEFTIGFAMLITAGCQLSLAFRYNKKVFYIALICSLYAWAGILLLTLSPGNVSTLNALAVLLLHIHFYITYRTT